MHLKWNSLLPTCQSKICSNQGGAHGKRIAEAQQLTCEVIDRWAGSHFIPPPATSRRRLIYPPPHHNPYQLLSGACTNHPSKGTHWMALGVLRIGLRRSVILMMQRRRVLRFEHVTFWSDLHFKAFSVLDKRDCCLLAAPYCDFYWNEEIKKGKTKAGSSGDICHQSSCQCK